MKTLVVGAATGLALLAANTASAQDREQGASMVAVLDAASETFEGRPFSCYVVPTLAGRNYEAQLRSVDFDALLAAGEGRDCSTTVVVQDDDSGDDTNSRLRFVGTGNPWFLRASSLQPGTFGEYELIFDPRTVYTPGLDLGGSATGMLDEDDLKDQLGRTFDCVRTYGMINQTVQMDLRSDDFDARLALHRGWDCFGPEITQDDDGGDGTNARLTTRLPESDTYSVRVSMFGTNANGAYTLSLTDMNKGMTGAALWGDVPLATGCGYVKSSQTFNPIQFKAAPTRIEGRRRLDGVVIVNGREQTREAAGFTYADGRAWFEANETISVGGITYSKYGLPRFIEAGELEVVTEHDGVAVAVAAGEQSRDVIYVYVDGFQCNFQPYQAAT